MYFETVDWATLKPSLSSSPGIRGAPQSGFSFAHTAHEISEFLINPGPAAWIVRSPAPPNAKTHPVPFGRHTGVHLRHVARIISVTARRSSSDSSMKRSVLREPHRWHAARLGALAIRAFKDSGPSTRLYDLDSVGRGTLLPMLTRQQIPSRHDPGC